MSTQCQNPDVGFKYIVPFNIAGMNVIVIRKKKQI